MKRIDSPKNNQVKNWKKLHTRRGREKTGLFLIEGFHLIEEALHSSIEVEYILYTEEAVLPSHWSLQSIDCILISQQVLKELTETKTPQGILAVCHLPKSVELGSSQGQYLLIDRVQDPGNVGTLIRTADAAGLTGVVLSPESVDVFNSKVIRASQGSLFHLPILTTELAPWIEQAKEAGVRIFGTALQGASPYQKIVPPESFALVMGNEGDGVADDLLARSDENLFIPIYGKAESLNVAVAAGVLLYHLRG